MNVLKISQMIGSQARKRCLKMDASRREFFRVLSLRHVIATLITGPLLNSEQKRVFHVNGKYEKGWLSKLIEDPWLELLRNSSYSHVGMSTVHSPASTCEGWREPFGRKELDWFPPPILLLRLESIPGVLNCLDTAPGQSTVWEQRKATRSHTTSSCAGESFLLNRASWSRRKGEMPDGLIVDGWLWQSKYLS